MAELSNQILVFLVFVVFTYAQNECPNGGNRDTTKANCLSPTNCSSGFSCLYSSSAQTYICCSNNS